MVLSVGMDVSSPLISAPDSTDNPSQLMLLGLMSMRNEVVYIQFHPVAYMVKLNIEMSMASLITKIALNSVEARNNEFMVDNSSSRNHSQSQSHFQASCARSHHAIGLQPGVNASAVSKMRGEVDREDFEGIRTLKEVGVTVEDVKVPWVTWRKSESDSRVDDAFALKQSKAGSEDELPLAPEVLKKQHVEWKN